MFWRRGGVEGGEDGGLGGGEGGFLVGGGLGSGCWCEVGGLGRSGSRGGEREEGEDVGVFGGKVGSWGAGVVMVVEMWDFVQLIVDVLV